MDPDPLLLVLLDLRKVYDNLGCGCILKTLEGYGAGQKIGHSGGVLGAAGGFQPTKWVPWPPVQGDPRNHTRGPDIYDTPSFGSIQRGMTLDVYDSVV